MSDVAPSLATLDDLILDKDWPQSVSIIHEEELCALVDPVPEFDYTVALPPDYVTDLDRDIEHSRGDSEPDGDDGKGNADAHAALPKLKYEMTVRSVESGIATVSKITMYYCAPNERPKMMLQTRDGFEYRINNTLLRERAGGINASVHMQDVAEALTDEVQALEELLSLTHNKSKVTKKGKCARASKPNCIVKEEPAEEYQEPARDHSCDREPISAQAWISIIEEEPPEEIQEPVRNHSSECKRARAQKPDRVVKEEPPDEVQEPVPNHSSERKRARAQKPARVIKEEPPDEVQEPVSNHSNYRKRARSPKPKRITKEEPPDEIQEPVRNHSSERKRTRAQKPVRVIKEEPPDEVQEPVRSHSNDRKRARSPKPKRIIKEEPPDEIQEPVRNHSSERKRTRAQKPVRVIKEEPPDEVQEFVRSHSNDRKRARAQKPVRVIKEEPPDEIQEPVRNHSNDRKRARAQKPVRAIKEEPPEEVKEPVRNHSSGRRRARAQKPARVVKKEPPEEIQDPVRNHSNDRKRARAQKPVRAIKEEPPEEVQELVRNHTNDRKRARTQKPARVVKEEPPEEIQDPVRNHSNDRKRARSPKREPVIKEEPPDEIQELVPSDDHVWVADYMAEVARSGKSSMSWKEIRPAFKEYFKKALLGKARRYGVVTNRPITQAELAELSNTARSLYRKVRKFEDFPVTFRRLCQILINPPRCYSKLPTLMNALKKVLDVDVIASNPRREKEAETFFFDDSKCRRVVKKEPKSEVVSDGDPDYDGENSHKRGSKKRQSDKQKRPRKDDSSPEYIPDHLIRKKLRSSKKPMSDLSNFK
ncbi:hypothetical protein Aduo_019601 [Ancylostoma duodenale]